MLPEFSSISRAIRGFSEALMYNSFSPPTTESVAELFKKSLLNITDPADTCQTFCFWLANLTEKDIEDLKNIIQTNVELTKLFEQKVDFITIYFNDEYEAANAVFQVYQSIEPSKITATYQKETNTADLCECKCLSDHVRKKVIVLKYLSILTSIFSVPQSQHFNTLKSHFLALSIFKDISFRAFDLEHVIMADRLDHTQVYSYFGAMGLTHLEQWDTFLQSRYEILFKNNSAANETERYSQFLQDIQLDTLDSMIRKKIYNRELLWAYIHMIFSKKKDFEHFEVKEIVPSETLLSKIPIFGVFSMDL